MTPSTGPSHPSDDLLLLSLEGDAGEVLPASVRTHLGSCGECSRRADRMRRRGEVLDARLAELDWTPSEGLLPRTFAEVQRRRRGRLRLRPGAAAGLRRAAAVAAVLLAGALFATPVRAWIADWASDGWSQIAARLRGGGSDDRRTALVETPGAEAPVGAQTEYRFVPEGSDLRLEFGSTQETGTVEILETGEPSAVLEIVEADGERASIWVLPDGVQVRNSAAGTASYRLRVPSAVRVLRLRIGSGGGSTLKMSDFRPGERRVLPLRGP